MRYSQLLKWTGIYLIKFCCFPYFVRNIYARNKVSILVYHNPQPEILERHFSYLSKKYNFISLSLLVDAIHNKDWSTIPPRSLVVTFDDGHLGNFNLLKILQNYKVIPTIYLCTRIIDTNCPYWWFGLDEELKSKIKVIPNAVRLKILQDKHHYSASKEYPAESRQALNKNELFEMLPFVDYGAHTLTHPVLTMCTEHESKNEISLSKRDVQNYFGTECRHFSYPNGDYSERELRLVKESGFLSARTIDAGWNDVNTDPYQLKIIGVSDNASRNELIAQLTGIPLHFKYLLKGSYRGKKP